MIRINKKKSFYFILFSTISVGDAISYLIRFFYGLPFPPLGFMSGIALSFLGVNELINMSFEKYKFILSLTFIVFSFFGIVQSDQYDNQWILQFFWYFSAYFGGYYFLKKNDLDFPLAGGMKYYFIILLLIVSLLIYGYERDVIDDFNYLRVGSGLFVFMVYLFFGFQGYLSKIIIYILGLLLFIKIDSRSWAYMWILIPLFDAFVFAIRLRTRLLIIFVIAVIVLFALNNLSDINDAVLPEASRLFRPLLNIEGDTSIAARIYLFEKGVEQIGRSPIFGHYNGFYYYSDGGGNIHNLISYWHQYGLIPFVIFLTSMLLSICWTVFHKKPSPSYGFVLVILSAAIILSIAALSFFSFFPFFALGCVSGYFARIKLKRSVDLLRINKIKAENSNTSTIETAKLI